MRNIASDVFVVAQTPEKQRLWLQIGPLVLRPSSCAKVRDMLTIATFAATSIGRSLDGIAHAIELILTIEPRPTALIIAISVWQAKYSSTSPIAIFQLRGS